MALVSDTCSGALLASSLGYRPSTETEDAIPLSLCEMPRLPRPLVDCVLVDLTAEVGKLLEGPPRPAFQLRAGSPKEICMMVQSSVGGCEARNRCKALSTLRKPSQEAARST